jgi:hypothetical protein
MKSLKFLAAAALGLAALVQSASAQTTFYVTGSTAYRTAAITAINALVGGAPDGSDVSAPSGPKNTSFIWKNRTYTDTNGVNFPSTTLSNVTIKATFTGSAAGIGTVSNSLAIPFLPDTASNDALNHAAYDDSTASTPHAGYPTHVPEIAFADVFQASSPFNTNPVNDNVIGIVIFKWLASKGFGASVSVEPNFLKLLWQAGKAPKSFLTGASADQKVILFATGRNPDSGTRITAFADGGIGINTSVSQFQAVPELTAANGTVTTHQKYLAETINGIPYAAGVSGQASGGGLANYMSATLATSGLTGELGTVTYTGAFYLTYLGLSDSSTALANGAVELSYKGVTESLTNVQQGHYSFWGYEHIDDLNLLGAGTYEEDFEDDLIAGFATQDLSSVGAHNDSSMKCKRNSDGGQIQVFQFVF